MNQINRRNFIKSAAALGVLSLVPSFLKKDQYKIKLYIGILNDENVHFLKVHNPPADYKLKSILYLSKEDFNKVYKYNSKERSFDPFELRDKLSSYLLFQYDDSWDAKKNIMKLTWQINDKEEKTFSYFMINDIVLVKKYSFEKYQKLHIKYPDFNVENWITV